MSQDAFEMFDNYTAVIYSKGDYDDYMNTYSLNEIDTLDGDLQPYSGKLLEQEYGLYKECQKVFYCGVNGNITEGVLMKINNQTYEVVYVADWEYGYEVMLKEVTIKNG